MARFVWFLAATLFQCGLSAPPQLSKLLLTSEQENCLGQNQIYWPTDGLCYKPATQGPCQDGQWIMLQMLPSSDRIESICALKTCQINPAIIEVDLEDGDDPECSSVVLPSFEMQPGEEIRFDAFGIPIYACQPKHYRHWKEKLAGCFKLGSRGPCEYAHETLILPKGSKYLRCDSSSFFDPNNGGVKNVFISPPSNLCNAGYIWTDITKECVAGFSTGDSDNLYDYIHDLLFD